MGANAFGQSIPRKEDTRLLTGRGCFTADEILPDDAHAFVVRSPHAHARIISIDAAAAREAPGVLAVFTGADWAGENLGAIPAGADLIRLPGTPAGQGYAFRPGHPVLAREKVRFVGDSVACIVAETAAQARDAAEFLSIEYDVLPAITDTARAGDGGVPRVWDEAPENLCFGWQAGDEAAVADAFARAAHKITLSVANNRVHVGSLETRGAIGAFADDRYTLVTGSQMPHGLKSELAKVLRVEPAAIRVKIADVGGSFGIKNAVYPEQALVLWAAKRLGRRVVWIGDRSDGFISDYQARDNVSIGELALGADGTFLALRVATQAAIGAYLAPKGQLSPTTNTPALAGVYRLPAIHVAVMGRFTHTAPTEVYRGAGRPEAVHLVERLVDEAARQTGIERMELRRRNLLHPADMPYKTALGLLYDSGDFPGMLDEALARAHVETFAARKSEAATRGKLRGIGIAHYCERVAGGWSEHAWLELRPDGRVTALVGTMSNGQGHETAFAQLVAGELGVNPEDVDVVMGDTDRVPSGHGTGGSASLGITGPALAEAAIELIERAKPLAADALEAAEIDIVFEEGKFRIAGTDRAIGLRAVAKQLGANGAPDMLDASGFYQPGNQTFPNGCHVAEVEIDPDSGEWSLLTYTMVHDFGRVLNPKLLEGQLQGGVAQGFGQAARERVVHDPQSGQVMTGSWMDYAMPRADDLPALELVTRATPSPRNPLGVKGCGEAGAAGGAPAVMNALHDALAPLGVATLQMPATAEQVWRAIRASRAR